MKSFRRYMAIALMILVSMATANSFTSVDEFVANSLNENELRLLAKYRELYKEVVRGFDSGTIKVASLEVQGPESRPKGRIAREYTYYSNGSALKRLDVERTKEPNTRKLTFANQNRKEITIVNESGTLIGRNLGKDGVFIASKVEADKEIGNNHIRFSGVPSCAYCVFEYPLEIWLSKPPSNYRDYRLTECKQVSNQVRPAVALRADFSIGEGVGYWQAIVDEKTGVLLEYEMGGKEKSIEQSRHGKTDYGFEDDGSLPKIRKFTTWATVVESKGQVVYDRTTHEVMDYDPRPADKSLFRSNFIGIDIQDGSFRPGWLVYVAIAVTLLVVAILFRMRNRNA